MQNYYAAIRYGVYDMADIILEEEENKHNFSLNAPQSNLDPRVN